MAQRISFWRYLARCPYPRFFCNQKNYPKMLVFKKCEIIQTKKGVREWCFSPEDLVYSLRNSSGKTVFEIDVVCETVLERRDDSALPNLKDFSIPRLSSKLDQERKERCKSITVDKAKRGENCLVIISMEYGRHVHCRKHATPILGIGLESGVCVQNPPMIGEGIWTFKNPTELAIILRPGGRIEIFGPMGKRTLRYTGLNELLRSF